MKSKTEDNIDIKGKKIIRLHSVSNSINLQNQTTLIKVWFDDNENPYYDAPLELLMTQSNHKSDFHFDVTLHGGKKAKIELIAYSDYNPNDILFTTK